MRLREVNRAVAKGEVRLSAVVERANGERLDLWFAFPESAADLVTADVDPFIPVLLPVCAFSGEPLEFDLPASPRLVHTLPELRAIYDQWFPEARQFEISVRARTEPRSIPDASAAFASLGVDSTYTMVKAQREPRPYLPPLRNLIYMEGLETVLEKAADTTAVAQRLREIAAARGLTLVTGRANFRSHFPLDWLKHYFGAGLSGTALALSRGVGAVLIPASDGYSEMPGPLGSHPMLDPLWSTESMAILHDGCERARPWKIAYLVEHAPDLVSELRVCLENQGGPENCGRCMKCVRTALTILVLGRGDLLRSLPRELPSDWEQILIASTYSIGRVKTIAAISEFARTVDAPAALQTSIDSVLARATKRQATLQRVQELEKRPGLGWIRVARNLRGALRRRFR